MLTAHDLSDETTPKAVSSTGDSPLEYVVDIQGMTKEFQRRTHRKGAYTSIKSVIVGLFRRGERHGDQATTGGHKPVIENLTLRIRKGTSVGIIGRNGSGKSTLLKLITGIYAPTRGSVSVAGRVCALIELGAGFHPDFTGRENVLLAGLMHGMREEEIAARFDEIVSFAELAEVIDDPVRTYSSGMFMRLGFSVAIHTDPDLLIVDEILSVGDAGFVAKCRDKLGELRKKGVTLLLVSHDLDSVERWCHEAVWLHDGVVRERGLPRRVIDAYRTFIEDETERELTADAHAAPTAQSAHGESRFDANSDGSSTDGSSASAAGADPTQSEPLRWGSREVEIVDVALFREGERHHLFHPRDEVTIEIAYTCNEPTDDIVFGIGIKRNDGLLVFGTNTDIERVTVPPLTTQGTIRIVLSRLSLLEGVYLLDVATHRRDGYPYDYQCEAQTFTVRAPRAQVGVVSPELSWEFSS